MTEKEILGNQIKTDIKFWNEEYSKFDDRDSDLVKDSQKIFEKVIVYLELN